MAGTEAAPSSQSDKDDRSSTEALRATLATTAAWLLQAEKQVRVISKTKLADSVLEGQVQKWTNETLWKRLKFIANDVIMTKVMQKAAKHFNVTKEEEGHWMSTYAHIVRDALNQKRNAFSQDMQRKLISKYKAR